MVERFVKKRMRSHASQYVRNRNHSDILKISPATSFVSTITQQRSRCKIRSVFRLFVAKDKTLIEIYLELVFV